MQPLVDAWRKAVRSRAHFDDLLDLHSGPLAGFSDQLAIVERLDAEHFRYLHYGAQVARNSGRDMTGLSTADFSGEAAGFFRQSYCNALEAGEPLYSINRAVITHHTHSWQRLLLPVTASSGTGDELVIALIRPLMGVRELLADFGRDTGIVGGTLEPIRKDGSVQDFLLQTLSDLRDVFGDTPPCLLGDLYGRPLSLDEAERIMRASDGTVVVQRELPDSQARYGRAFLLRISGGRLQPVFSLTDETQLIEARNSAEERKQAMQDFAETASDWMWEADTEHRVTYLSPSFELQNKRPARTYLGKSRLDFANYPKNSEVLKAHQKDLDAKRAFRDLIYQLPDADGSLRWIRVNGVPRFSNDGAFIGYRGTGSDVTAEIEARDLAERRRRQMEEFAATGSDWLWESDGDHRITMISDAVTKHSGFPIEYYIGRVRTELGDAQINAEVFAAHIADLEAQRPFRDFVYSAYSAAGELRYWRISGNPQYDEDGEFVGYRGTGSNITEEMLAKQALEDQKAVMKEFADTASDWMWEIDDSFKFTMMSQAIEKVTGSPSDRYVGVDWFALEDVPENRETFGHLREQMVDRQPFRNVVYKAFTDDGVALWLRSNGNPRFDEDGTFLGYRGTASDVTDDVQTRKLAAERAQELGRAYKVGKLGAWWYDRTTDTVHLTEAYRNLVGLSDRFAELSVRRLMTFIARECRPSIFAAHRTVFKHDGNAQADIRWRHANGNFIDLTVVGQAERDSAGKVVRLYGTVQDITARKEAERELERLAYCDPLTGLGNRAAFNTALDALFANRDRSDHKAGLLLLDLDNFKEVNDTLGHSAGDELLRTAASRLVGAVTSSAAVYRLGGDEFAVIARDLAHSRDVSGLGSSIKSAFAGAFNLQDGAVHVTTSIGMVMVPEQTNDPHEAMRFADLALYRAKELGRNRHVLFHDKLDATVRERVALESDLRDAVNADALDAHYQVQVDIKDGSIAGFEALVRWTHPERGVVPPNMFIPIAEASPMIGAIGAMMLKRACSQGKAWLDAGGAPLNMAVNVSVAQLWHRDVAADVRDALNATGFPAHLLTVELTESVFEDTSLPRIQSLFAELKQLGVKMALDDFGTGYSSLKYLDKLSFDRLKIDRSFVHKCDQDAEKRRLLQGIVGLSSGLGLQTVVEGVETEAELDVVRDMGCNMVQGYYFARPKPFHEACLDAARIETTSGLKPLLWRDSEGQGPARIAL